MIVTGFLWTLMHASIILSTDLPPRIEGRDVIVEGIVSAIPEHRSNGMRFQFDIENMIHVPGDIPVDEQPRRVMLNWYGDVPPLVTGDTWRLKIRLKRPHGFMNPGGFDYEGWLFQHRIRATGYVRHDPVNRLIESNKAHKPLQRLRQRLADTIHKILPYNQYSGIIAALAIGERQGISPDQWEVLTRTGTSHLVAISGLHIGLVAGLVFFIIRGFWSYIGWLALRWPAPKAAAVAGLLAATCYAALAGFSIPTQRALVMIAIVMLSIVLQRHRSLVHTLLLALFAVLVMDPLAVMSAGFWLSFAAVAVILFGMSGRIGQAGAWWRWGRIHLLIMIGLLPLMLILFQRVPVLSPVANFIAVPWISLLVVPVVLLGTVLLITMPTLGGILLSLGGLLLSAIWPFLAWVANLDLTQWPHQVPVTWTLLPAIAGTVLLIAPRGIPGRWLGAFLVLPVFMISPSRPAEGEVWFTLLDVGQGLASVIQTHDHVLVYDTGPRFSEQFDAGKAAVIPYLRHQGLTGIDMLIIGHGDSDHIGGAESIWQEIEIKHALSSVPDKLTWMRAETCNSGQDWHWDAVDFQILHPPRNGSYKGNNASCVLRISNRSGSILLTGDIEKSAEHKLLEVQHELLASTILVAPHHGSKTSSTMEFIRAVSPAYVLFPVGYMNRFGFPREDVIKRYQSIDAKLYNSAQHGAISFKLGTNGMVSPPATFRQDGKRYWHSDT